MVNVPEHDRSDVLHGFLSKARVSSTASLPATPALPDPQLNEHRTVVGELIPDRFALLAVVHLAERGAIDPGQDPAVDDEQRASEEAQNKEPVSDPAVQGS